MTEPVLQSAPAIVQPSSIPFKHEAGVPAASVTGGALGLLLISLLAIGVVLFLRKRFNLIPRRASTAGLLRVLETQRLGPRTLLSVVEFSGSHYLVAQGEHGVSCIASAPVTAGAAASGEAV
jgi:flagellar biogenesis protein FliO